MIGTIVASRFELTGLLSEGPIFASYSARDQSSGREICVRLLRPPFDRQSQFLEALKEAADQYSSVRGLQIEPVLDVASDNGHGFIVTELTRGPSLADRIRKLAPFSVPVSVGTAISVCQALEPLHRSRLCHGDLSPANIAILANGDAKLQLTGIWEAYGMSPTAGAMVLPSMAPYLAPEVSGGQMPSPKSDVYAIGIMLFELLSGRLPYYADTPVAMAMQHATSPTPSVRQSNPSVPAVLDEIVKKAMAKDPGERYSDAGDICSDLRQLQDALRFGRTLAWPLRASTGPTAAPTIKQSAPKPTPKNESVAPRMSAIRTDEEFERETRKSRNERDVPMWMTLSIVFLAAVVLSLIGVWMMLNLNRPRQIAVPNVVGLTLQEARAVLSESKLEMRVEARLPSDKVEMDKILEVKPNPGEKIIEGTRVNVVVSSGSRFVAIPDLRGLTVDKAKGILSSLGLELDPELLKERNPNLAPGLVIRSTPNAKTKLEKASRVKLVVSTGADGGDEALPVEGQFLYTVRVGLVDLTEPTEVRIDIEDSDGAREIYRQDHNPGDRIERSVIGHGKTATFHIYYNDVLVKSEPATAEEQ
ncbi:MAG TPA: PASTA domain-containing protein [Fimbriimonas sp.]|nr:PASTA domain-containing protein [Fimbriimonas sp.]